MCSVLCTLYTVYRLEWRDRLHGGDLLLWLGDRDGDREAAAGGHVAGVRDDVLPGPGCYTGGP